MRVKHYNAAAKKGHVESMYKVACCYNNNEGVLHRDKDKALEWFTKAAANNHPAAHYGLGIIYLEKCEYGLAWENFNRAKQLGYVKASKKIAEFHLKGYGDIVPVDYPLAYETYQQCKGEVEFTKNDWINYGVCLLCYSMDPKSQPTSPNKTSSLAESDVFPKINESEVKEDLEILKLYKNEIFAAIIKIPQLGGDEPSNQVILDAVGADNPKSLVQRLIHKPLSGKSTFLNSTSKEVEDILKNLQKAADKRRLLGELEVGRGMTPRPSPHDDL